MIIIIFYKHTRLADAPDELFKLLNKMNTKYKFIFIQKNISLLKKTINDNKSSKIIVHFHNKLVPISGLNIKKIIHYHSEPSNTRPHLVNDKDLCKLVLNQYHCTLKEYKSCDYIVRNYFSDPYNDIIFNDKIKVGFYPSSTGRVNKYADKGYSETKNIFNKLVKKFPNVIFEIQTKIPYKKCIESKRDCHIIIDECKTGSFHKSTLEGLSLGSIVIVNINNKIIDVHKKLYNNTLPIINSNINDLENNIEILLNKGKHYLEEQALISREKYLSYWNDKSVSDEYFKIYESLWES